MSASPVDERLVSAFLDDRWCTVAILTRRAGCGYLQRDQMTETLRRMAQAGKIEKREHNTTVPKYRRHASRGVLVIEFYRRLQ